MKRLNLEPFLPLVGVFGLIALWYLAVLSEVVDPILLPPPTTTFRAMWNGMVHGKLGGDFLKTVERTTLATVIAAAIAIPLGIKGAGEAGAIPVGPLFAQAVEDALDLGARGIEILEIPLSPSRLWQLLTKAK